jgi:hypothetical protein
LRVLNSGYKITIILLEPLENVKIARPELAEGWKWPALSLPKGEDVGINWLMSWRANSLP